MLPSISLLSKRVPVRRVRNAFVTAKALSLFASIAISAAMPASVCAQKQASAPAKTADLSATMTAHPDTAAAIYHEMLLDYRRYTETLWHRVDPATVGGAAMGYWGTGRSNWNNEGTRAQSNTALVYALLWRNGDHTFPISERVEPALRYSCAIHLTGDRKGTDKLSWGNTWQSAMWAANLGTAAWLVRDQLSPETLNAVKRVLAYEADRFVTTPPPTMTPGNTKAEENAWDLTAPAAAVLLMPDSPKAKEWHQAALRYGFNTLSVAQDKHDETIADGKPVREWATTEQLYPDYTLENHGFFHPVYAMVSPATMTQAAVDYSLGGRPVPDALKHNVLPEWEMLRYITLPDGEWLYTQGLDWDLHDYEHIHYWAMLATLYKDPAAAVLERRTAINARKRQVINGDGRFVGPSGGLGFAREAVQAERVAFAALMHERFGPIPAADPAAPDAAWLAFEKTLATVRVWDSTGFLVYRMPQRGVFSFSWKNRLMGLVAPDSDDYPDTPYVTTPNTESLVGGFKIEGQTAVDTGKWKISRRKIVTQAAGFTAAFDAFTNGGKLRQEIAVVGAAPGMLVYMDRVTATAPVTITEERGLPVALENDDVSGNKRSVVTSSSGEAQVFNGGVAGDYPFPGKQWANVDGRLALVVATPPRLLYRSAGAPNRSGAREDLLYGVYDATSRSFQSGAVVAERAAILIPNGSPVETARIASSIVISRENGNMTLRYDGPDGHPHALTLTEDGRAISDDGAATAVPAAK